MPYVKNIQVGEAVEAQYVPVEEDEQLTEAPVTALQDTGNNYDTHTAQESNIHLILFFSPLITEGNSAHGNFYLYLLLMYFSKHALYMKVILCLLCLVNIQQITEFNSETHDAVTSMVAMAPGTVTVVQQVNNITSYAEELMSGYNKKKITWSCG